MRINTNTGALNSWRGLYNNDMAMSKSLEKLSSGLRINRSSDDAGGMAVSETLRAQVRGLQQAEKNSQDGIGYLNVADSTMEQVHGILQRMRELSVQAANGTLQASDRTALQQEFTTIRSEIDRLTGSAQFNGTSIFTAAVISLQVGQNNVAANDRLAITVGTMTQATLAVNASTIATQVGAQAAITSVNTAITTVSTARATAGANINRLEYTIANLQTTRENMAAAESRIRDTDMASEMTNLTKNQILVQSATAMLAQANAKPQSVLALLQ